MNILGRKIAGWIVTAALWLPSCSALAAAPTIDWVLKASYPHDRKDFTQGLVWTNGKLYESTGHYGHSRIAEKALATGQSKRSSALPVHQFAEGLAWHQGAFWQLTWREGLAHVYNAKLKRLRSVAYQGEGWGLTSDGEHLIVSDGSNRLQFVNADTFTVLRSVHVTDGGQPVTQLNELEWINGALYANIWHSAWVAQIDPKTGVVTGWLDLRPLLETLGELDPEAVLNGLAWRPDTQELLVTGKWWPKLFALRLVKSKP